MKFLLVTTSLVAAAAPQSRADSLIVAGLPAVVEYAPGFWRTVWDDDSGAVCIDFTLLPLEGTASKIRLTTSGLGEATVAALNGGPAPTCPGTTGEQLLELPQIGAAGQRARLRVPGSSFPHNSSVVEGKIVALIADRSPVAATVKLQRQGWGPFWRAILWFSGLLVPATLTAAVGLLVYQRQKSIELRLGETSELNQFRKDTATDLAKFFEPRGLYHNIVQQTDDAEYSRRMAEELGKRRILSVVPSRSRERIIRAIRRSDRKKVATELASVFPDQKRDITSTSP